MSLVLSSKIKPYKSCLLKKLTQENSVDFLPAEIKAFRTEINQTTIILNSGKEIKTQLLIGADVPIPRS